VASQCGLGQKSMAVCVIGNDKSYILTLPDQFSRAACFFVPYPAGLAQDHILVLNLLAAPDRRTAHTNLSSTHHAANPKRFTEQLPVDVRIESTAADLGYSNSSMQVSAPLCTTFSEPRSSLRHLPGAYSHGWQCVHDHYWEDIWAAYPAPSLTTPDHDRFPRGRDFAQAWT
jgi:hypothetical protein